jgi:hypothetical protein
VSSTSWSEQAREAWQLFRARSVYFQLKTLVLVVYATMVAATVVFVVVAGRGRNDLGASVTVLPGDPIMGCYFVVRNESKHDWLNVKFEIDGGYQQRRDAVLAGQKVTLYLNEFKRQQSVLVKKRKRVETVSAPASFKPTELRIETHQGITVHKLPRSP